MRPRIRSRSAGSYISERARRGPLAWTHRRLGVPQQLMWSCMPGIRKRRTHAHFQRHPLTVDRQRRLEGVAETLGDHDVSAWSSISQMSEFVAANAGNGLIRSTRLIQATRYGDERSPASYPNESLSCLNSSMSSRMSAAEPRCAACGRGRDQRGRETAGGGQPGDWVAQRAIEQLGIERIANRRFGGIAS